MRNISPEDAKTTSEVLDRILKIRRDLQTPREISLFHVKHSVVILKTLLALYQPQIPASFYLIPEGKRSKGGRNSFPSTPRPAPPKGQGKKTS